MDWVRSRSACGPGPRAVPVRVPSRCGAVPMPRGPRYCAVPCWGISLAPQRVSPGNPTHLIVVPRRASLRPPEAAETIAAGVVVPPGRLRRRRNYAVLSGHRRVDRPARERIEMGQYAVLGLGEFGRTVARTLADLGHEVLCVDSREQTVQQIAQSVTRAVVADLCDRDAIRELPLGDMDGVVVAMGANLEASVLATLYLREMGIERIIAKATREDHGKILRALGVTEIVSPEREMGEKVARKLTTPNFIDYFPLQPGISVRELAPPASFLGQKIVEIPLREKWGVELLAVRDASQDKVEMLPPQGLVLEGKDRLVLLGRDDDLDRLGRIE